jgi:hypothetical protein
MVSDAPRILFRFIISVSDMYICQIGEKSKYFKKPYDKNYYYHKVENLFDFVIHGDESIDDP